MSYREKLQHSKQQQPCNPAMCVFVWGVKMRAEARNPLITIYSSIQFKLDASQCWGEQSQRIYVTTQQQNKLVIDA